jgi:hypothetical protein
VHIEGKHKQTLTLTDHQVRELAQLRSNTRKTTNFYLYTLRAIPHTVIVLVVTVDILTNVM